MEETVLRASGMKSDEKPFFCQIYAIVWGKMVHVVIDKNFSLFLKSLKTFLNPRLSLIVPLIYGDKTCFGRHFYEVWCTSRNSNS